jgi:TetR/AcrR family transcriptional regulator, mexJK operon transcriptional repressor
VDRTSEDLKPRARAKRDQIRMGAQRLFLERGFGGTSTDAIAAEAGVSKQTLYAYYPSKEELFADVMRWITLENPENRLLMTPVSEILLGSRDELRRTLAAVAQKVISTMMRPDYLALLRVVIAEAPRMPHLGELFSATVPKRGLEVISTILGHARERGMAEIEDVEAARMFLGSLVTYAILDGLLVTGGPPRQPAPERIEGIVDLYMKAIS